MTPTIQSETLPPSRDEIIPLMDAYYQEGVAQLAAAGGPTINPARLKTEFWAEITDFLPPSGRFYTARDDEGVLLGYISLRSVDDQTGEVKRFYVVPTARGHRLGLRLIEALIGAARDMGLRTLKADTWHNNAPALHLYETLGFRRTSVFADSATYRLMPHVAPFMAFVEMDLQG